MTQAEYEQKKRECWEEFIRSTDKIITPRDAFSCAFDRSYALGKQEKDAETSKKPKRMCLRDKSKACNLCHKCDIETDEWYSMSR